MVKLDKIYTRGGDKGLTSLVGGARVGKNTPRLAAMGDVDEANAILGLAKDALGDNDTGLIEILARVQNDLCDLGADLATPGSDPADGSLRMQAIQVTRLEAEIDTLNESLDPLTSFILPGGATAATWLHLARTVVRRAERSAVAFAEAEPANENAIAYLNRLSDLIFVMARHANDGGKSDVTWEPGKYGE